MHLQWQEILLKTPTPGVVQEEVSEGPNQKYLEIPKSGTFQIVTMNLEAGVQFHNHEENHSLVKILKIWTETMMIIK